MDSQLISVLIGIGMVVGLPLLEKWIEKIKQGRRRSAPSAAMPVAPQQPRHQRVPRPPRQPRQPRAAVPNPAQQAAPVTIEGERVTADTPHIAPPVTTNHAPVSPDDLRKGVIWSIILGKPHSME